MSGKFQPINRDTAYGRSINCLCANIANAIEGIIFDARIPKTTYFSQGSSGLVEA